MSVSFELNAEPRSDQGKGASRRLRREGKVPAILYGGGQDPQPITLSHNELFHALEHEAFFSHVLEIRLGDRTENAVLKDLQRHPAKPIIMHADFQRVVKGQAIRMQVPLHFTGEERAPGVKEGGLITHHITAIDVECDPTALPEYIEVDVSGLGVGDVVHLTDIALPDGVVLVDLLGTEGMSEEELAEVNQPVVSIHARKGGGEEEETAAEGGEEAGEATE
ncbi:50S ribosomal protein L25/general stress protein Ctc [Thiohalobacter sp.]|uniref:50S ribosomal protein L25/general stress protein Ctc n=1 Tax=Thiohalobacter sp. TaxID=2025948 RepID=UPI00260B49BF|nr:50S ribosomal protein L25/general stress protein Ctc [Thiohalobacter sp.]